MGKTHLAACLCLYWYLVYNPSICLSTAPTEAQVVDLIWRQLRDVMRQQRLVLPIAPAAPIIQSPAEPMHYAKGLTARDASSFQGRHERHVLVVFDEATGVVEEFWNGARGMTTGRDDKWLCIFNPTDTTSEAYAADISGNWDSVSISALEHPNVLAELAGMEPPYPSAVSLDYVEKSIIDWCTSLGEGDEPNESDFEWPPGSGKWYRPGPLFEARVLGRWPSQGVNSIFSEALIAAVFRTNRFNYQLEYEKSDMSEIGCDVARFGDDFTSMHARRGPVSLHHETHNGWEFTRTAEHLKELAREHGRLCGVDGRKIPVKIDVDGLGAGVVALADGFNFIPMSASRRARKPGRFPNRRSEYWFALAERARNDLVDLSRLSPESRRSLRAQLMAPQYDIDSAGRKVVEEKRETKKRLGRSPDDADACNLSYAEYQPRAGAAGAQIPGAVGEQRRRAQGNQGLVQELLGAIRSAQ